MAGVTSHCSAEWSPSQLGDRPLCRMNCSELRSTTLLFLSWDHAVQFNSRNRLYLQEQSSHDG